MTVIISRMEVLAAFRCSYLTAEREGFHRKAEEVAGYIRQIEDLFGEATQGIELRAVGEVNRT